MDKKNLLSTDLSRLPTGTKRTYYGDDGTGGVRGLLFVIQPSGHRSFELYRKVAGVPKRIGLGPFDPSLAKSREIPAGIDPLTMIGQAPALNARMARSLAAALNVSLDQGVDKVGIVKKQRAARAAELTLQKAFDLYYDGHIIGDNKRRTDRIRQEFDRLWGNVAPGQKKKRGKERMKSPGAPDWSNRKLSTIEPSDVRAALLNIKNGAGARSANVALVMLTALFNWLPKKHYQGESPCTGLAKFKAGEVERRRYLGDNDPDELRRFYKALGDLGDDWFADFVHLGLITGARLANILGMRWRYLNLETGYWTVPKEESKHGEDMRLILTPQAVEILNKRRKTVPVGTEWVFPSRVGKGHKDRPSKQWSALLKAAAIENFRIHDLRHTTASWLVSQGVSLPMVGRVLGHQSVQSTARYAHLVDDAVREHLEAAEGAREAKAKQSAVVREMKGVA